VRYRVDPARPTVAGEGVARVVAVRELIGLQAPGVDDAPPHVRAASGLARLGADLWIVQDDTHLLVQLAPGQPPRGHALPPGEDGRRQFDDLRGNKRLKADLESLFCAGGALWGLGSGSSPRRERVMWAAPGSAPDLHPWPAFYAALRDVPALCGAELNLEGAARWGRWVVVANRGNGAATAELPAVDALGGFLWAEWRAAFEARSAPRLRWVTPLDLGRVEGVRWTVTDLAPRGGALTLLASAEDSPNAVDDGPVVGVAIGEVGPEAVTLRRVLGPDGEPWREKCEGLVWDRRDPDLAWIVTDADDPRRPARLLAVRVERA
jgi:hypothetical protein